METIISDCGKYRYSLYRSLTEGTGFNCVFIMLNPSTADATLDDPTIRRCKAFAKSWGCADLFVLNLFAYRATKPDDMKNATDPVGPENKTRFDALREEIIFKDFGEKDTLIVCAWGVHGGFMQQDETVLGWLNGKKLYCLGRTKEGHPRHPLYVSADTKLKSFDGGAKRERMKEADCPASPQGEDMMAEFLRATNN